MQARVELLRLRAQSAGRVSAAHALSAARGEELLAPCYASGLSLPRHTSAALASPQQFTPLPPAVLPAVLPGRARGRSLCNAAGGAQRHRGLLPQGASQREEGPGSRANARSPFAPCEAQALTYSPKWFYHDDVWISAYLHGAAQVRVYRAQRGRDGKNCQQGKAVYDYLFLSRADGVGALKGDLSRHTLNTELMQAREEMARDGLLPGARLQPSSDQWSSDRWVRLHHGPRPSRRPA